MVESQVQTEKKSMWSEWKTPANIVTMVRIVLVVAFIVMTVEAGPLGQLNIPLRWASLVLFIVAGTTDKVDGYLARSRNQVTDLGKLLDPIADKLLVCSALVILSAFGELFWWITILFLIREVGITLLRFFAIDKMNLVIAASSSGKLKTVFEITAISLFLAPMWIFDPYEQVWTYYYYIAAFVVMILALELCLWSGGEYLLEVRRAFKKNQSGDSVGNDSTGKGSVDESKGESTDESTVESAGPASLDHHVSANQAVASHRSVGSKGRHSGPAQHAAHAPSDPK